MGHLHTGDSNVETNGTVVFQWNDMGKSTGNIRTHQILGGVVTNSKAKGPEIFLSKPHQHGPISIWREFPAFRGHFWAHHLRIWITHANHAANLLLPEWMFNIVQCSLSLSGMTTPQKWFALLLILNYIVTPPTKQPKNQRSCGVDIMNPVWLKVLALESFSDVIEEVLR